MNDRGADVRPPRWMGRVLWAAAVYNVLWGGAVVLFPVGTLGLIGVEPPRYPQLWQVIGMIIGVYGVGYAIAATNVYRHWPIVLVGFLGKTFGPLGYVSGLAASWLGLPYPGVPVDQPGQEALPAQFGWTIIPNDLVWWPLFAVMLWHTFRFWQDPASRGELKRLTIGEAMDAGRTDAGVSLRELSMRSRVLVVFLRHAGCTFCREAMKDLGGVRDRVESSGVQIVVVHQGREESEIRTALERAGLASATVISDPTGALYRAFSLPRGTFMQLFGPRVWARGVEATLRGHIVGTLAGDGFQLGGVFVLEKGEVVAGVPARDAADRPDYVGIACGRHASQDVTRATA